MRVERLAEGVTVVLGDCREYLATLADKSVDAIVSDPPYGINYQHSGAGAAATGRTALRRFTESIEGDDEPFDPSHLLRWPCVLFGADHYCSRLPSGGTMHVWDKAPGGAGPKDSFSDAELFWSSWTCSRRVIRYLWKGVCQDGEKGRRKFHPMQKPEAVMMECVGMTTGTVCDPYAGSGSTGVACVRLGRRFIGIEIDERYFSIACRRISAALNEQPLFAEQERESQPDLFEQSA